MTGHRDSLVTANDLLSRWGWQSAPDEIMEFAAMAAPLFNQPHEAIVESMGHLSAEQISEILAERPEATKVLDFLIQREAGIAPYRQQILAIAEGLPYFETLRIEGVELHEAMRDERIRAACEDAEAALVRVQERTDVLVFADRGRGYTRFMQMSPMDRANNPIVEQFGDALTIGFTTPGPLLEAINEADQASGEDDDEDGNVLIEDQLREDETLRRLADMHMSSLAEDSTDIHIDPDSDGRVWVRHRIFKDLEKLNVSLSMEEYHRIKNFLLLRSGATLKHERVSRPLDGMYAFKSRSGKTVNVRCSYIGLGHSGSVTDDLVSMRMRIMPVERGKVDLTKKRIDPAVIRHMENALRPNNGLVLMVGPTGSGKSTTLAGMIGIHQDIHGPSRSRLSVEDPVERFLPGVTQIQIPNSMRQDEGVFALYLRSLLRHDPDLIWLGEVRDAATAEAAVNASSTGHLVVSTVHAETAPEALDRMSNMIPPENRDLRFTMVKALSLIVSQRLIKRVCQHCSSEVASGDTEHSHIAFLNRKYGIELECPETVRKANLKGCKECRKGYIGIQPINEVLEVDREVKRIFLSGDREQMEEIDRKVTIKLPEQALKFVKSGEATFDALYF